MILSHSKKFIFFAVPRTGTHSAREVLRAHLEADDWEQQVLNGRQLAPIDAIAKIGHGHISVREIRQLLTTDIWETYYKFAIVRNPFDRFISVCSFLNRGNDEFRSNPIGWMKAALRRPKFKNRVLVRPQLHQLVDANNKLGLDYIGRYEDLQKSIDSIMSNLGLPITHLNKRNSSAHADYRNYYDEELQEIVASYYKGDLELFGYDFQTIS